MKNFRQGLKDGIPIALCYFAVAFSLGIAANSAGVKASESFIASLLINASAGQYALFVAIKEQIPYFQIIFVSLIANARYLLMSFAMSQKFKPEENIIHRLILGFFLTDEAFGLAISQDNYLNPYYSYGAILVSAPCWALGCSLGVIVGNVLPAKIVATLAVSLYGMFLAIIIPPCKKDKTITVLIIISFITSYLLDRLTDLSSSVITIILTIIICSLASIIKPIKEDYHE